jgi:hypothetical protein
MPHALYRVQVRVRARREREREREFKGWGARVRGFFFRLRFTNSTYQDNSKEEKRTNKKEV